MATFNLKDATIELVDGTTPTANVLSIKVAEGELTFNAQRPRRYRNRRGVRDVVINDEDAPMEVSLSLIWEFLRATSGDPPTPMEVFYNDGEAAGWTSVSSNTCEDFAIDIRIVWDPGCSPIERERITFQAFRHDSIRGATRDGSLTVQGRCNAERPLTERLP